jgi:hypothetical protein
MRKFQVRPGQAIGMSRHCPMELAEGTRPEQYKFDVALTAYRQKQPKHSRPASATAAGSLTFARGQ